MGTRGKGIREEMVGVGDEGVVEDGEAERDVDKEAVVVDEGCSSCSHCF